MRVDIVTLFPEMCQQVLDASILGRAAKRGYIETVSNNDKWTSPQYGICN